MSRIIYSIKILIVTFVFGGTWKTFRSGEHFCALSLMVLIATGGYKTIK